MRNLSVKEHHIYVTQGLQRQGSYRKDKQLPQAIDLALNAAQNRLIKARIVQNTQASQKFEINQKHVSDIQRLLVLDVELPTELTTLRKSYGVLPYDFAYLLSDKSYIIQDCDTDYATATETKSERLITFVFDSNKTSAFYYTNLVVSKAGSNTITMSTVGVSTTDEKVYLVDKIIEAFKSLGVSCFWQSYKDTFISEAFIIPTRDLTLQLGITVDAKTLVAVNIDKTITVFKSAPTGILALNRDTKIDFLDSANISEFHRSTPDSPLSVLSDNKIIVIGTERFLANKILISYIRKPKSINLDLKQDSELGSGTHEEIGDLAIQIIKKQIEDESYVIDVRDNQGRIE